VLRLVRALDRGRSDQLDKSHEAYCLPKRTAEWNGLVSRAYNVMFRFKVFINAQAAMNDWFCTVFVWKIG